MKLSTDLMPRHRSTSYAYHIDMGRGSFVTTGGDLIFSPSKLTIELNMNFRNPKEFSCEKKGKMTKIILSGTK
jgi:hypothetical protein